MTDCIIAGNHDFAAVGKTDITGFNEYAQSAVIWTGKQLTNENAQFLSSLPLAGTMDDFFYVHAAPHHPEQWDYILTMSAARESFDHFSQRICFVGHSHGPLILAQTKTGNITTVHEHIMTVQKDFRYIINIGSVGQPRDGDPRAAYGMYDSETKQYRLIRVAYDITTAQNKIIDAGLPSFLAARLAGGH
jgi:diadenosine tetraphosphatase ApaH/serine/threonine PP2A family protein phosphatase